MLLIQSGVRIRSNVTNTSSRRNFCWSQVKRTDFCQTLYFGWIFCCSSGGRIRQSSDTEVGVIWTNSSLRALFRVLILWNKPGFLLS